MRVQLQPAYLLHTRAYRDTSLLLEAFTPEHGRIGLVAKGARRSGRSGRPALQPFVPLLISYSGRGELKTLSKWEMTTGQTHLLQGQRLYSGLYMNELLMRLLHRNDPHPTLFAHYVAGLTSLSQGAELESCLRTFEYGLIEELGYGFSLTHEGVSGEPLQDEAWYSYDSELGLIAVHGATNSSRPCYRGGDILALVKAEFDGSVKSTAKRLLREVLSHHLGDVPLRSRELFHQVGSRVGSK